MACCAARQRDGQAHVGVVAQAPRGTLRLGHKGQSITVHHGQAHQFTGLGSQAVEQRLCNVHDAAVAQEKEAERDEFDGQHIVAMALVLAHITAAHQLGQQAVGGA